MNIIAIHKAQRTVESVRIVIEVDINGERLIVEEKS
jgi:hypothetical protein